MACVLTVAVVKDGVATIGHVGDARLHAAPWATHQGHEGSFAGGRAGGRGRNRRAGGDAAPRRNEVYRDVGSEPRAAGDPGFIEIRTLPVEPDAALVLCSDGLSDLVPSAGIARLVERHAGNPQAAVRALIAAANHAGGKDNVTALCVLGPDFAATVAPARMAGLGRRGPWARPSPY